MTDTGWMVALQPNEEWKGVSNLVVRCENGHRFGAWPQAIGRACLDCEGTLAAERNTDGTQRDREAAES